MSRWGRIYLFAACFLFVSHSKILDLSVTPAPFFVPALATLRWLSHPTRFKEAKKRGQGLKARARDLQRKTNSILLSQPSLRICSPQLCTGHWRSWLGRLGETQKGKMAFLLDGLLTQLLRQNENRSIREQSQLRSRTYR